MAQKETVVVGLSGGVDSSVSAYLLKQQGYEVIGIFLKNWDDNDPNCPAAQDALDARAVAKQLDIPFYSFDFSKNYWEDVFEKFLEEHRKGRTPNPDIWCNQFIKFHAFLDYATKLGADYLATGHYARVRQKDRLYQLCRAVDDNKDQTYFLYTLNQDQLSKTMFPLADIPKPEVRAIAERIKLPVASKKDSTGICFVGERNHREFLEEYIDRTPGNIVEKESGNVLGEHLGMAFYTIGQRKDLHIGGVKDAKEAPWYVVGKDFENNQIVVSQNEEFLMKSEFSADTLHWVAGNPPADSFACEVRTRHRAPLVSAEVAVEGEIIHVNTKTPVRAITPGQSVVLYLGDVCLGGGEII